MKALRQLGKDLKSQVQQTGVAAAKADKLELGVLGKGFVIGQKQSTGPTSTVEEATKVDEATDARHPLAGKVWNALNGYLAPFSANHSWVEDGRGDNVCEAQDARTAKALVELLNEKFPKPDRLK